MPTDLAKELGRIALLNGFIDENQLEIAFRIQDNYKKPISLLEILVRQNYITKEQAEQIIEIYYREEDIIKDDHRFGGILLRCNLATIEQVKEALKIQNMVRDVLPLRLGEIMVLKKYITLDDVNFVLEYQRRMKVKCATCQTPYNLIKFVPNKRIRCYVCNSPIQIPFIEKKIQAK